MSNYVACRFLPLFFIFAVASLTVAGAEDATYRSKEMTYQSFTHALQANVHEGIIEGRVQQLLGKPSRIAKDTWYYNLRDLPGFPGLPPAAGKEVIVDLEITFSNGKVVSVSPGTICATGAGQQ